MLAQDRINITSIMSEHGLHSTFGNVKYLLLENQFKSQYALKWFQRKVFISNVNVVN